MEQFSTINTSYGIIKGIQKEGYQVFKGIRYATANRFERPVICHRAENDPYDATLFGYTCPQPGQPEGSFYFREFWHHLEYATVLYDRDNVALVTVDGSAQSWTMAKDAK